MLSFEQRLIRHHNNGKEPWDGPMSLAHQAARQGPGMYLMAAACLENTLVVAVPFKGEGSFFVKLGLDDHAGNMHTARRRAPLGDVVCPLHLLDFLRIGHTSKTPKTHPGTNMLSETLARWLILSPFRFVVQARWGRQFSASFNG